MIFTFGSNLAGRHGAGAALAARREHGAELGVGQGMTGNAYAIPTKDRHLVTLPLMTIAAHVQEFLRFADVNPQLQFQVTRIGCGLAGYTDAQIAPLFAGAPSNCDLPAGWREVPAPAAIRAYAGIGSRSTPPEVLERITAIAGRLAGQGWTLNTGGAQGADTAFARGALKAGGAARVILPWADFNGWTGPHSVDANDLPGYTQARAIAKHHHPAWDQLSVGASRLMTRNVYQVLGLSQHEPVRFVLCWAPTSTLDGERVVDVVGGTGLAVRLAVARGIPVFNLALAAHQRRLDAWVNT